MERDANAPASASEIAHLSLRSLSSEVCFMAARRPVVSSTGAMRVRSCQNLATAVMKAPDCGKKSAALEVGQSAPPEDISCAKPYNDSAACIRASAFPLVLPRDSLLSIAECAIPKLSSNDLHDDSGSALIIRRIIGAQFDSKHSYRLIIRSAHMAGNLTTFKSPRILRINCSVALARNFGSSCESTKNTLIAFVIIS